MPEVRQLCRRRLFSPGPNLPLLQKGFGLHKQLPRFHP